MSFRDCLDEIARAAPNLNLDEVEVLVSKLQERARVIKAQDQQADFDDAIQRALNELSNELDLAAKIEKRNLVKNIIIRNKITDYIDTNFSSNPFEGLKALLVGSNQIKPGARLSIDAQGKAMTEEFFGMVQHRLQEEDLLTLYNTGALDREIAREMWEIGRAEGRPGISGSRDAQRIAKILHDFEDGVVNRQNRAGAWIKKRPGYIVRQSHDRFKLRRAGYEAWRDYVLPRLDATLTFKELPPDKVEEMLRGMYDGITSGIHFRSVAEQHADEFLGFKGPANLASRLSEERVIHFQSADDWFDYNERFGTSTFREAYAFGMDRAARNIALMEGLGTNPNAMLDDILNTLRTKHRDNAKQIDKLKSKQIESWMAELDGSVHVVGNPSAALVSSVARAIQNMAKLGMATVSALTDVPLVASELRFQGHNLLEGYGVALGAVGRGRGNTQQRQTLRLIGVGMDGIRGSVLSRFAATDSLPGRMAKLQNKFFKWNLLSWWTDAHKNGVGLMMANHMATMRNTAFDGLEPDLQRLLSLYDISDLEWYMIRKTGMRQMDGRDYFTPDLARNIPDDVLDTYINIKVNKAPGSKVISAQRERFRDQLETKMRSFYVDRAEFAVPTPGAREFALMRWGTQSGTVLGDALRFIMQFKAFPITVLTRPLSRDIHARGAESIRKGLFRGQGDMLGLTHTIMAMTAMGYVAMSAKDMARGRTPRDATDPETWMAAAAQGGGFGIYGDFMFGQFNRFGRSFTSSAVGPTFGQADDLVEIYTRFRQGDDATAQAVRLGINNTPFLNLFYTRMALDYMFLYQIQESLNPGYLGRLQRRIEQNQGQEFMFPPSQAIPYGGGDRIGEGVRE